MAGLDSFKNDAQFCQRPGGAVRGGGGAGDIRWGQGASRARRRTRRTDVTQPARNTAASN